MLLSGVVVENTVNYPLFNAEAYKNHEIFFRDVGWFWWVVALMSLIGWAQTCLRVTKQGITYKIEFTWIHNLAGILLLWPSLGFIATRLTDVLFTLMGIKIFPYAEFFTPMGRIQFLSMVGIFMQGLWNWGVGAGRNNRVIASGLFFIIAFCALRALEPENDFYFIPHSYGASTTYLRSLYATYGAALGGSKTMATMAMKDVANDSVGWAHAVPLIMLSLVAMAPVVSRLHAQMRRKDWVYVLATPLVIVLFLLTLFGDIAFHSRTLSSVAALISVVLFSPLLMITEKRWWILAPFSIMMCFLILLAYVSSILSLAHMALLGLCSAFAFAVWHTIHRISPKQKL